MSTRVPSRARFWALVYIAGLICALLVAYVVDPGKPKQPAAVPDQREPLQKLLDDGWIVNEGHPPADGAPEKVYSLRYTAEMRAMPSVDLELVKHFPQLQELWIYFFGQFNGDDLVHIEDMTTLTRLQFCDTGINDATLDHLKKLTKLKELDLLDTPVGDEGLAKIAHLTSLESLTLTKTRVTDAGLQHLKELVKLRELYLDGTKISDRGLKELTGLTKLETITLWGTNTTGQGIEELKQALPNLKKP